MPGAAANATDPLGHPQPWLTLVGIGADGLEGLSPVARIYI
jgi:hypothetical protein